MRCVIQRVLEARVEVAGEEISRIGSGLLIFVGFGHEEDALSLPAHAAKIAKMRIFSDAEGKMNHSLLDTGKEVLIVSQFTLYANCSKGNRPSFIDAMSPGQAEQLYNQWIKDFERELSKKSLVKQGSFGADMKISLINDGPVTLFYG